MLFNNLMVKNRLFCGSKTEAFIPLY